MAVQSEDSNDYDFAPGYAECVAQAANSWAFLEYSINTAIWALADTKPGLGACITAQIINLNARLNSLLALMKQRGMSEKLIKRVNKFADDSRGPNELRNRIVHDIWMLDASDASAMGQFTLTAAKKLEFSINTVALEAVQKNLLGIIKCRNEAIRIRDAILAELPTLPDVPHPKLHPITESRSDQ